VSYHLVIHCAGPLCPAHILGPAADCFGSAYERRQLIADALARGWYRAIDERGDRWYCADCRADLPAWCHLVADHCPF
jgi:hypothetical protein